MANTDRPNGFQPLRYMNGAPYNGAVRRYVIPSTDATATFVGDLVKITSLGDAAEATGLMSVAQAAASDSVVGAVVGFEPAINPNGAGPALDVPLYRAASTRRVALVADDPNILFVAQEDGVSDPIEMIDVGANINFVVGTGSTVSGASAMELDSDTHATTSSLTLKLMGFLNTPDNEWVSNGQANTRWVVKINNHQLGSGTGSVGLA
jgi:hypothetical protein